jgi:hypothetical protein
VRGDAHKPWILLAIGGGRWPQSSLLLWPLEHSGYDICTTRGIIHPHCRSLLYMRRLKLLTVLVTLLTLPGYGFAGLGNVRSCQAQMQAPDRVVMGGDCCPGKSDQSAPCKRSGGVPGKSGSCTSCKAGYNCKSPQSYEPTHLVTMLVVPTRPILTAELPTLVISYSSNGLWRPPRSI